MGTRGGAPKVGWQTSLPARTGTKSNASPAVSYSTQSICPRPEDTEAFNHSNLCSLVVNPITRRLPRWRRRDPVTLRRKYRPGVSGVVNKDDDDGSSLGLGIISTFILDELQFV